MSAMATQITGVSLFNQPLFRRRSKETSKLRVTGLCDRNSPVTGEFPAQKSSKAENLSFDDVIMVYTNVDGLSRQLSSKVFHIRLHEYLVAPYIAIPSYPSGQSRQCCCRGGANSIVSSSHVLASLVQIRTRRMDRMYTRGGWSKN